MKEIITTCDKCQKRVNQPDVLYKSDARFFSEVDLSGYEINFGSICHECVKKIGSFSNIDPITGMFLEPTS